MVSRRSGLITTVVFQLNLGLPNRALSLTEASLPAILSHGSAQEKGRALLLLARCRLACTNHPRINSLQHAISILSLAQDLLKKAKDIIRVKHCYYLKVSHPYIPSNYVHYIKITNE